MINFIGHMIGRYQILELIGHGRIAVVYKALDTRLDNEVALKFIKKEEFPTSAQEGMLQSFEREARFMASLNHPNIVKVTDYGEYEGYPYLVMPYLAGGTLKAHMGKPMPWREVVRIILSLTQALEYAHKHQEGAPNRGIKPSNILMTESNEPVLDDFGITRIQQSDQEHILTGTGTGTGTGKGMSEYMAPEQWMGQDVDRRADVYTLGVVMYELLTGRHPYKADNLVALMLKQATESLPRPRMFVDDLPENLERIVLKTLAKDPKDRFQSMEELGNALEGLTPEPKPIPMPKWVKLAMFGLPGVAVLIFLLVWFVVPGFGRVKTPAIESGQTATAQAILRTAESKSATQTAIVAAWTVTPSKTPVPSATPTAIIVSNVPPTCKEIGQKWKSPIDGMTLVCVPAGSFTYDGDPKSLSAFWIDIYEVTNAQYARCAAENVCTPPPFTGVDKTVTGGYYDTSTYAAYPVIFVSLNDAQTYCDWAGRRVPTEVEWQKAARGPSGERDYPWGSRDPSQTVANFNLGQPVAVGSYPKGVSPYGVFDMVGNVREWTTSLAEDKSSYYVKGGSFDAYKVESNEIKIGFNGTFYAPDSHSSRFGFRCVFSPDK